MNWMDMDPKNLNRNELLSMHDYLKRRLELLNVLSDARERMEGKMIEVKARLSQIGA